MTSTEYAHRLVDVLRRLDAGETQIRCPKCGHGTVLPSYTRFGPDRYGTWLQCDRCDMQEVAHSTSRPPRFREELINPGFQQIDEETWARVEAKIKGERPPD